MTLNLVSKVLVFILGSSSIGCPWLMSLSYVAEAQSSKLTKKTLPQATTAPALPSKSQHSFSLESYLLQVKKGHKGIRASEAALTAADLKKDEANLLLTPLVFGAVQNIYDKSPTLNQALQGDRTNIFGYSLGVQTQTDFGTTAKLSYNGAYTSLQGTDLRANPMPAFFDSKPLLEVSQALMRNANGEEIKSNLALASAQFEATTYSERFKTKILLAQAEGTFWRLALARQIVSVQQDTLARAKKIRDWNGRRVQTRLGDRSDFLQAEAAVKFRELELQVAIDEEAAAARDFNSFRGVEDNRVSETLPPVNTTVNHELETLKPVDDREDVKAALVATKVAAANAEVGINRNRPTLDAFANLGLNGRDKEFWDATGQTMKVEHPYFVLGVRFSTSVDFETMKRVQDGYAGDNLTAQLNYQRKREEVTRERENIIQQLRESRERLRLAKLIEDVQRDKLDNERDKFTRGRTVTYQVLMFEQDYASAQLNVLRFQTEYLRLAAQLKTFGGAQ